MVPPIAWIAALPAWQYGRRYGRGYYPFGALSALLLIFLPRRLVGAFAVKA
jgi:hypothetical protein